MTLSVSSGPNIAFYPPGATFGPRQLRNYEFVWMLEGDAHYLYERDGRQHEIALPQGTLLLCQPGCSDQFVWDALRPTRHGYFHFSIEESPSLGVAPEKWPQTRRITEGDLLDTLFRHMVGWSSVGLAPQRNALALAFFSTFVSGETQARPVAQSHWPDPVRRTLEWMLLEVKKDSSVELDLKILARAACVSPEYLCRIFKKTLGCSPLEAVRLLRVDRAALLLSRSNYSVTQVAHLTGFESPFHFSRVFKGVYGLTPRELQRLAAAGQPLPPSRWQRLWNSNIELKDKPAQ